MAHTIFVLDDEPDFLRVVARMLESVDANVVSFLDPGELLETLRKGPPPSLILTDHDLGSGVMNGAELSKAARDEGFTGPIMMWSGGNPVVPETVTLFRRKPLAYAALVSLVEGLIESVA